jgi:hypothetical protein
MAGFKSFLSAIGHVLGKIFNPGVITSAATVADILLPQFRVLIDAAAAAVINAETSAIAAGKQGGSGEQKAALVVAAIEKEYAAFALANNIPVVPGNVQKFVDAVVAALNSFPAPTDAP